MAATKKQTTEEEELDNYATKTKKTAVTSDPLDYYATDSEMDRSYRARQTQLDTAKRSAQQNAAISYELLNKYLPIQNKMNGLHGLGVSESAAIDAQNQYATRMGEIAQTHAADSAALLENYRTEQKSAQNEAYEMAKVYLENSGYETQEEIDAYLSTLAGKVNDAQYQSLHAIGQGLQSQAEAVRQDMVYNEAMTYLTNLSSGYEAVTTFEELDNYLSSVKEDVSDLQYNQLTKTVERIKNNPTHQETDSLNSYLKTKKEGNTVMEKSVAYYSSVNGNLIGGTITIEDQSGDHYNVIATEAIKESAANVGVLNESLKHGKNTVFIYDGDLYLNRQGSVYKLAKHGEGKYAEHYKKLKNTLQEYSTNVESLSKQRAEKDAKKEAKRQEAFKHALSGRL